MANEYKCDICGKPATVHITKIIDGKKVKVHLCSECAEKASFDAVNLPLDIFPKLKELEKMMSKKIANPDSCPNCGASLSEIEKGARFSCSECYRALGNRLFEILAQMHAATDHKGKSLKTHEPNCPVAIDLSKTLRDFKDIADEELFQENFESALEEIANAAKKLEKSQQEIAPESKQESKEDSLADTEESLRKELDAAISEERYEDAASLRDKLKTLEQQK